MDPIANQFITITGGTGHTGRRVVRRFLERGAKVRCLLHNPNNRSLLPDDANLEIVGGSADRLEDLVAAARGADALIHLAHIRYSPFVISALGQLGEPVRLVAMSSTRLLSRYATPVREEVRRGEEAIRQAPPNIQWTILRPAMIFGGPDDNNLERLAAWLRRRRVFPLFGSGRNLVQPIFVWDLVQAITACLESPAPIGKTYNLAGSEPIPYREMVRAVAKACGARPPIFLPLPLVPSLTLARTGRALWPGFPLDPEMVERFGEDKAFDCSEARRDLGFEPIPFTEALKRKFSQQV